MELPYHDQAWGSPPRMRGKAVPAALPDVTHGITPAYAGKRNGRCSCSTAGRDHPRVCGEKPSNRCSAFASPGSPPRVQGKVLCAGTDAPADGITPACAGKSSCWAATTTARTDYPRVCGEKPTQTAPTPVSPISSMARWVTRVPGPSSSTEMPAAGI